MTKEDGREDKEGETGQGKKLRLKRVDCANKHLDRVLKNANSAKRTRRNK
jgi:hypothetical protein